jgi:hypothetical protein
MWQDLATYACTAQNTSNKSTVVGFVQPPSAMQQRQNSLELLSADITVVLPPALLHKADSPGW